MTTIQLSYEVTKDAEARVQAMLDATLTNNVNWNGATFLIERGDVTSITDCDEINGASLIHDVYRAIDGE